MRKFWLLFSQTVTVALAFYFVVVTLRPEWLGLAARGAPSASSLSTLEASAPTNALPHIAPAAGSLAAAAQKASPAVVSISTSNSKRVAGKPDPWLKYFAPREGQEQGQGQVGLGSGVIVSPDGYILTNNHVVEGADDIEVFLNDGRRANAKVVGVDPESDLAVLKITLNQLPVIVLGNSEQTLVGDAVLAIGSPFGVGQTVTSGIVSALRRDHLGINTFENFIQTDAAINPGNSGGALVDINGNLLGINTAIYSRSGGSMGIGFAIPVNLAKQVMQDIVKDGAVTRAWMGIEPRDFTPELAVAFKIKPLVANANNPGVIINNVMQNGPADKAGIKIGDILASVAGTSISNTAQATAVIAGQQPNIPIKVQIIRNSKPLELSLTPSKRPQFKRPN